MEGDKHLKTVEEFIMRERAEVVCLMEACEQDMLEMVGTQYPYYQYAPNDILPNGKRTGVMILANKPITLVKKYYCGEGEGAYLTAPGMGTHSPILLLTKIGGLQIGAVHFSWTPDGHENLRQEAHLAKLLEFVKARGEMVLCGDFNIPRGYKLYHEIARQLKDNIPTEIVSTIDPHLHRANKVEAGKLALMVDYVWSTPKYEVKNVRVVSGVSDHCGVVATLIVSQ